jgi:RNA polymerase-associated protein LEO1
MGVCPVRFDPDLYNAKKEEESTRVALGMEEDAVVFKSENIVRWRYKMDANNRPMMNADGTPVAESNARVVQWSDGSLQLLIGNEALDLKKEDMTASHSFLFAQSQVLSHQIACIPPLTAMHNA